MEVRLGHALLLGSLSRPGHLISARSISCIDSFNYRIVSVFFLLLTKNRISDEYLSLIFGNKVRTELFFGLHRHSLRGYSGVDHLRRVDKIGFRLRLWL